MFVGERESITIPAYTNKAIAAAIVLAIIGWALTEPIPFKHAAMRPPLASVRWFIYDAMMRLHARIHILSDDVPITIIAIDELSLRKLGGPPVKRKHYAELIRRLSDSGAKVIALDILFSEKAEGDAELISAIKEVAQRSTVILASNALLSWHEGISTKLPEGLTIPNEKITGAVTSIPAIELPALTFPTSGCLIGVASLFLDEDGICRRVPLMIETQGNIFPSFALAALCGYYGMQLDNLHGIGGKGLWVGEQFIPLQSAPPWFGWRNEFVLGIDFVSRIEQGAPQETSFKTYTMLDALSGSIPSSDISGHIAIIGATAPSLPDFRSTPLDPAMNGVEIFAHAIYTLLHKTAVRETPSLLNLLFGLILSIATCILLLIRPMAGLLLSANILVACFVIPLVILVRWHIFLSPLCALVTWLSVSILVAVMSTAHAERRANYLVNLIGLYVSPQIAKQLAKASGIEEQLRGQKRDITILFSDIRGFTELSHSLQPYETISLLSRYFTVMSEIVFLYGGMVNNMMGDGLMAIFGVMPDREDHAERAVLAAWHMIEALEELQFEWERMTGRRLAIGIGVNSGEAIVGDIRTPYKRHFTAIGDCVNLAQRLEQLTKEFNCSLLIGEETYERTGWMVIAEKLSASVKGYSEPIVAYKVIGFSEGGKQFRRSYLEGKDAL